MVTLAFSSGTLELTGLSEPIPELPPSCQYDPRTASYRARAVAYADLVLMLRRAGIAYEDRARGYAELLGAGPV